MNPLPPSTPSSKSTKKKPNLASFSAAEYAAFFQILKEHTPKPISDLNYTNHFTLLVAVVLSAQSTDKGVNKATKTLFEQVSSPAEMIALGEPALKEHIKTIGLFNTKARNVMALSALLIRDYGGQVPNTRAGLMSLPGVGRKTANVVLNVAFGEETFAVDTHIFRVGNRTGIAPGKTPDHVENVLDKIVPAPYRQHAHHWLILLGRYTCVARKPKCAECLVRHLCHFSDKTV